jgi:hypothetical protein
MAASDHPCLLDLKRRPATRFYAMLPIAILTLASCSYSYILEAVEHDGKIIFQPKDDKGTGCLTSFAIRSPSGEIMWELDSGSYTPRPCQSVLPVVYAVVPKNMTEKVKAKTLKAGVTYAIEGWDGDNYRGSFSFRQAILVQNFGS